jgi:site-specific recombinase XerD
MRVSSAPPPDTNADLLEVFRRHLVERDLAPATVRAYLHDLARFHTWFAWVHEGTAPRLTQVRTVDLAAFRAYLIHEQAHTPTAVNRRLQGLRVLFRWLYDCHWITENPAAHLRFMRKSGTRQPPALRRREVFALVHAAAASPHGLAPRNVALVQLMLQAGLRVGEVTHLTHADLHLGAASHRTRPHCVATSTTDSWFGYGHPALWRCDKTHTRDRGERWRESSTAAAACSGAARYW